MFRSNDHHQGAHCLYFAKVTPRLYYEGTINTDRYKYLPCNTAIHFTATYLHISVQSSTSSGFQIETFLTL
jgi:hypothetical protein